MASKPELELPIRAMEILQEKGLLREGEALGDFVMMCELTNWADEKAPTRYAIILPSDRTLPPHRLAGLIQICSEIETGDDE